MTVLLLTILFVMVIQVTIFSSSRQSTIVHAFTSSIYFPSYQKFTSIRNSHSINTNSGRKQKHLATATASRTFGNCIRIGGISTYPLNIKTIINTGSTTTTRYIMTDSVETNDISVATQQEQQQSTPTEMTADQRYLFDLNGYIIVRGVLTPEEIQKANEIIDKHSDKMIERSDGPLRNAKVGTPMYGTGPGRKDLGGVLEWGKNDSRIFQSILAHPKLVPYFRGLLGVGYRMDHLPFVLVQDHGSEGFALHGGTIDCSTGQYNPELAYNCMHGTIRCSLLGCNVMLTDHNAGDGGFCIVPGSHKSNFRMPSTMIDGEQYSEFIQQPITKAGDVVLFSEGTVHGALPWTNTVQQRRACLYRFAPATMSYGRSYFGHPRTVSNDDNTGSGITESSCNGWPSAIYDGLTESERAVLEPPYNIRLDRPCVALDGTSIEVATRSPRKKKHDMDVFGTKYF
jgi:Phytanoyl-CoA dioxygenase (PhyH)